MQVSSHVVVGLREAADALKRTTSELDIVEVPYDPAAKELLGEHFKNCVNAIVLLRGVADMLEADQP